MINDQNHADRTRLRAGTAAGVLIDLDVECLQQQLDAGILYPANTILVRATIAAAAAFHDSLRSQEQGLKAPPQNRKTPPGRGPASE